MEETVPYTTLNEVENAFIMFVNWYRIPLNTINVKSETKPYTTSNKDEYGNEFNLVWYLHRT